MNTTIRQRKNGKYQAIVSYKNKKGKWIQKSKGGFEKRKDASEWASEISYELKKLEKSGVLFNNYTLEEVFELYMEFKEDEISYNSKALYKQTIKFFKNFKDTNLKDIKTTDLLRHLKTEREKTGSTYNMYVNGLKVMLNFAIVHLRALDFNPCLQLTKDKKETDTRLKFIDEKLYKEIIESLKNEKEKLLIRVLYETGMRIGEALGITTQNIKNGLIEINKQYSGKERKITTKLKTKNSYRKVPITQTLFIDLKKATTDINGLIFYGISRQSINQKLKKFNISPHCFRHTRATILISSGIDPTVVANVIGDNINTILTTYVEVNKNDLEEKYKQIRKLV